MPSRAANASKRLGRFRDGLSCITSQRRAYHSLHPQRWQNPDHGACPQLEEDKLGKVRFLSSLSHPTIPPQSSRALETRSRWTPILRRRIKARWTLRLWRGSYGGAISKMDTLSFGSRLVP